MRVPEQVDGNRLVDHASIVVLERAIAERGGDPFTLSSQKEDWSRFEPDTSSWIERAARNLTHAIVSSLSVMDFEAVVIEGALPESVKQRLVEHIIDELQKTDLQGILLPTVEAGQIGRGARTIGAAAALIASQYLVDQNTLLRV